MRNSRSIGMPPSASGSTSDGASGRIYALAYASPVAGVNVKVGWFESVEHRHVARHVPRAYGNGYCIVLWRVIVSAR
jgi:hypothetical protein